MCLRWYAYACVYVCVPASACAHLLDRCLSSHKEFNSQYKDRSSYCAAYGWLLIIQLSLQNRDLFFDADWFLVRLHQAAEHLRLLTSISDLSWAEYFFYVQVFTSLYSVYGFLYVRVYTWVHVLEWLDVHLFTVCVLPCVVVEWRAVPCLILGGWCVMCLGLWLRLRCDVYLCLWGIAVTAFYICPMPHFFFTAKSP